MSTNQVQHHQDGIITSLFKHPWFGAMTRYVRQKCKGLFCRQRVSHPATKQITPATTDVPGSVYIKMRSMLVDADVREPIFDRQVKVPGFDMERVRQKGVFSIGAGGLFGQQARGLTRKGYPRIGSADSDVFAPSNFPRQLCYGPDLYQNKAVSVIQNLAHECLADTEFWAYPLNYPAVAQHIDWDKFDVFLCNVDNNVARVRLSVEGRSRGKPVIFSAVSSDAGNGYVFVQESKPDTPCFGCAFPHMVNDKIHPCPGTPACVDILTVVGGFVLYAVDSVIMNRPRFWNLRRVYLDGSLDDQCLRIAKNPNCPLCKAT